MNNFTNASLSEILERINAGKAALELNEIDDLFVNLSIELNRTVKENFLTNDEEGKNWLNILNGLFETELANPFMKTIEKDLFFGFGEYLLKCSVNKNIESIIHNYLNLFRNSSFLQKIYDERRWDDLIHKLIVKSFYTFDVLFNQRVNQYKKKNLFRIIKDGQTIDYTWQKTSEIVSQYRSSISHILF